MAFTQQTFLGASIRSFNGTIGWGSSPSKVTIRLVEDATNGDVFSAIIGAPVIFTYDNWSFAGIIKSHTQDGGSGGSPLYTVIVEDPRNILSGVELILNNYNGSTFGMPNLLNVFGFLEVARGFGGSNVTAAGIPWRNVRDAVVSLTNGANATYGNRIALGSFNYEINLTQLPNLPEFYRVAAQDMSLMDYISEICNAANHEYFFTLDTVGAVNSIKLHTINRNIQPTFGAISNFVNSTPGAVQKNAGLEFRDEITSKFVVGGNLIEIFHNSLTGGDDEDFDTGADNNIWPYWGTYDNGNVAIGDGINNDHTVLLDSSWVEAWPFSTYITDVGELRAALGGQSSWETYLWLHNFNIYREDGNGEFGAFYRDPEDERQQDVCEDPRSILGYLGEDLVTINTGVTNNEDCARWGFKFVKISGDELFSVYKHSNVRNPHFGKASIIGKGIGSSMKTDLAVFLSAKDADSAVNINPNDLAAFDARATDTKSKKDKVQEKTMFEYIKDFAEEYYGKRFMVRIPFTLASTDSDTGEVILSRQPEQAGFLEESVQAAAISNNLAPPDVNKFTEEDGRLVAYVRYLNASSLDFGDISVDDININETTNTAFIKVQVDPEVQFVDRNLLFSPRAIITMPGVIRPVDNDSNDYAGVIKNFLTNKFTEKDVADPIQKANDFFIKTGSDAFKYDEAGLAILPNDADVPLKSNINTYGPWFAAGANGKLDFEQDDSLVPWNYGGFTAMNRAAEARVTSAISNEQISEAGSIEFPGTPTINMGSQLQGGGPYITDINVQISTQGVTTTYQMKTWTPQPYKLRKEESEASTRSAIKAQRVRRSIREGNKTLAAKAQVAGIKVAKFKQPPKQEGGKTTSSMITGEMIAVAGAGDKFKTIVGIQPSYNLSQELRTPDYINKAGISLDGIFQPFSVDGSGSLPSMGTPELGASVPTVTDLNPYAKTANYGAVIGGSEFRDISNDASSDQIFSDARSIALRGPVIIAGYSYDDAGNPTPSGEDGNFITDVNKRPDQWNVGPLDIRWNNSRKLYEAGSNSLFKIRAEQVIPASEGTFNGTRLDNNTNITIDNFLKQPVASGKNALGWKNGSVYHILQAEFSGLSIVSDLTCTSGTVEVCTTQSYTQVNNSGEACG